MKRARRLIVLIVGAILSVVAVGGAWFVWRDLRHYAGPAEEQLSLTGLYSDIDTLTISPEVQLFAPQFQLWSDGAGKRRFLFLPEGARIDTSDPERWNFPIGARLWKEFERDGVVVETRMLLKTGPEPADWDMAVYLWRDDRSDADKIAFSRADAGGTRHDVPGPRLCVECHGDNDERRPLGFTLLQLPWDSDHMSSLTSPRSDLRLTHPPDQAPTIPGDEQTRAALGYLHANCGSCHYQGSTSVPSEVSLRLNLTIDTLAAAAETNAYLSTINQRPHTPGLGTAVLVAPGQPEASFLWRRMRIRDGGGWQMPPLASEEVDQQGVAIVGAWIEQQSAASDRD